jgi:hypothetical protein
LKFELWFLEIVVRSRAMPIAFYSSATFAGCITKFSTFGLVYDQA